MKIKINSKVQWTKKVYEGAWYECTGTVVSMKESTFGSKKKGMGARILIETPKLLKGRHTFVSVDNVSLLKSPMILLKKFKASKNWYYWNSNITAENFPEPKTMRTEGAEIVRMDKYFTSKEALATIAKKGLRAATIYQLMEYADKHPEAFPDDTWTGMIALGTDFTDSDGNRRVPSVYRISGGGWRFNLGGFGDVWDGGLCLLCFRDKSSDPSTLSDDQSSGSLTLESAIELVKDAGYVVYKLV